MGNQKQPEVHNKQLEVAMKEFKENQTKENMINILRYLEQARIMQPALLPPGMKKEEIDNLIAKSENGKIPQELSAKMRPQPMVIKNPQGERFFLVYTDKEQIPKSQKYPAILFIPFADCAGLAVNPNLKLSGVVVNPFTDNLIIHKAALEAMSQKMARQGQVPVGLSEADQVIQVEMAKRFHKDRHRFMNDLSLGKEEFVSDCYQEYHKEKDGEESASPYRPEDFEVMVLNISGNMQMAQIGLKDNRRMGAICLSSYCFYNPETEETVYYIIKIGSAGSVNLLACIDKNGGCTELGPAPEEGEELYTLMNRVPWAKKN